MSSWPHPPKRPLLKNLKPTPGRDPLLRPSDKQSGVRWVAYKKEGREGGREGGRQKGKEEKRKEGRKEGRRGRKERRKERIKERNRKKERKKRGRKEKERARKERKEREEGRNELPSSFHFFGKSGFVCPQNPCARTSTGSLSIQFNQNRAERDPWRSSSPAPCSSRRP
ncbi:Zinc finger CCCH domain-containing protein 18, partial [Ophiophagus hannah]